MSRKQVFVGGLPIGGGAPVRVESMLKIPLADPAGCIEQARSLAAVGCELVRAAFPQLDDAPLLGRLCRESPIPVMADVHFDHRLALAALEAGCVSVRLNPGNMPRQGLREVVALARERRAALRVGANGGSLGNAWLERAKGDLAVAMAEAVEEQVRILLEEGFDDVILAAKATNVAATVRANGLLSRRHPFPLHVGITEAGSAVEGIVKSSCGLALMLAQGIGDTLRVSLTGPPEEEVRVGYAVLRALDLRQRGANLVSCPTCGRKRADVAALVEALRPMLPSLPDGLTLAVMGCEVNGPREAAGADLGIAGSPGGVILFRRGAFLGEMPASDLQAVIARVRDVAEALAAETHHRE